MQSLETVLTFTKLSISKICLLKNSVPPYFMEGCISVRLRWGWRNWMIYLSMMNFTSTMPAYRASKYCMKKLEFFKLMKKWSSLTNKDRLEFGWIPTFPASVPTMSLKSITTNLFKIKVLNPKCLKIWWTL